MTKSDFIQGLKCALAGAPDALIMENLQYYNSYIDGEVAKGRTEEEVLAELGEPRWIAKSILDAEAGNTRASESTYDYAGDTYEYGGGTYEYDSRNQTFEYENPRQSRQVRTFDLSKWYVKALLIAVPLLVLFLFFTIMGFAFKLVLGILFSPIFWGIAIGVGIAGWFLKRR